MDQLERSEELHDRVRRLAGVGEGDFQSLALAIADFQATYSPGFARLVRARRSSLDEIEAIPAVPTDAFRLTRVAVHGPELDVASFHTSGTTRLARGTHYFRTLETYRSLSLLFGSLALRTRDDVAWRVVSLAPAPSSPPSSSLSFMMQLFQKHWGVPGQEPDESWLVRGDEIDVESLFRTAGRALDRGEPLLVLATAFALVALLDRLREEESLRCPELTVVMVTGGFKGRSREVSPERLRRELAQAFDIPDTHLVGEYGMTELTSQLYEGTLPGGRLSGPEGVFLEPPWLKVIPVDPVSLTPVPDGEIGLAKIIDLGNVDSALAIQTQDRVRRTRAGIELLGRQPGAPPRGCSLAIESLLG